MDDESLQAVTIAEVASACICQAHNLQCSDLYTHYLIHNHYLILLTNVVLSPSLKANTKLYPQLCYRFKLS